MDKNNSVKIFIDGSKCCSKKDCSGDCEGYAFIEKKYFLENYLKISGFSSEDEFFSNYLYHDSEKILEDAIKNNKLIDLKEPSNCNEFKSNEFFTKIKRRI